MLAHPAAVKAFTDALTADALPHAWLFAGKQGIGKATLAQYLAKLLLVQPADDGLFGREVITTLPATHPAFALLEAGAHPDYHLLQPVEKKTIGVDEVRTVLAACQQTKGVAQYRVIVVDSLDACTTQATNALLKMLEEPPPATIFLLVCHQLGRLLPTIRSRCRLMRLQPPTMAEFQAILPDADATLYHQCGGNIGMAAIILRNNWQDLVQHWQALLATIPPDAALMDALKLFQPKRKADEDNFLETLGLPLLRQHLYHRRPTAETFMAQEATHDAVLALLDNKASLQMDTTATLFQALRLLRN